MLRKTLNCVVRRRINYAETAEIKIMPEKEGRKNRITTVVETPACRQYGKVRMVVVPEKSRATRSSKEIWIDKEG